MRITDVCPLVEDAVAIAALYQCILRLLYRLRRQNQRWRQYPPLLIRENRWRAQRYGIEQGMVDFGKGAIVPLDELLEELFELVAEDAEHFGTTAEVQHARTILKRGTSADRQLARFEEAKALGGDDHAALVAVVDEIVEETMTLPETKTQGARGKART
jgi:carboxylate-amine ligase